MWAKKVKGGNLFAGLSKGPQRTSTQSKPETLAIPLKGQTEGGKEIGKNLRAQEQALSAKVPFPPASFTNPGREQTSSLNGPTWGVGSLDSVRASIGFLEEHLNSLMWIQECLISHQKSLVRTRLFTEAILDSISRAMYVQNRFKDMKEVLTGGKGEDE